MTRRVLVAYGSRRGSTAEIAASIAEAMRERGLRVDCARGDEVRDVAPYDAVIVGGALYAGRWVREARRFLIRHARALRRRPVWLFSSGPLGASGNQIAYLVIGILVVLEAPRRAGLDIKSS